MSHVHGTSGRLGHNIDIFNMHFSSGCAEKHYKKVVLLRFDLFRIMIKLFVFIKHNNMRFNKNTINVQSRFER